MTITTDWYDNDHWVIVQHFDGSWSWEDLNAAQSDENRLASSVDHAVIVLVDMSRTNTLPKGNVLAQGRASFGNVPNNVAKMIVVLESRMIEVFANIVIDMLPGWRNRAEFAKTMAEGERLVTEAVAAIRASTGTG